MSHKRKDTFSKTTVWAKHLRPFWKRQQNKRERREGLRYELKHSEREKS